jgi:hypothetical protein
MQFISFRWCTNFSKIWEPPKTSRCQKGDVKKFHTEDIHIRLHHRQRENEGQSTSFAKKLKGSFQKETVNISSYKLNRELQNSSLKQSKMNCKGKTDSKFLVNAYFIYSDASMTAAMLRDMTKNTPCTFHSCRIISKAFLTLFSFINTPLLICFSRNNCSTLRTLGATWLILE